MNMPNWLKENIQIAFANCDTHSLRSYQAIWKELLKVNGYTFN